MNRRRAGLLALPLAAALTLGASPSPPAELTRGDFPELTDRLREQAVTTLGERALEYSVDDFSQSQRIVPLAVEEEDGEETVVSLATDILFAVDDATLSPAAGGEVARLVAEVPAGAAVAVEGHTDTVASDEHNQQLSERRAATVADAVRAARPDLAVTAAGFGESWPKVDESGDDVADDRRQNRRVELRYATTPDARATPTPTPTPVASVPARVGTTPRARVLATDAEAVATTRFPSPALPGVEVVVGVEHVAVRGATTELSLLLSLEGDVPQDAPDLYDVLDDESWDVTLVDRAGLLQYADLSHTYDVVEWAGEGRQIGTHLTGTHRYVVTFPRLLSDDGPVDVVLDPGLPPVTDVPVDRE